MDVSNTPQTEDRRFSNLNLDELKDLRNELNPQHASKLGKAYLKSIDRRISELTEG